MAVKTKPYEQFGAYILFKKLEADSLSELWRAARIDNNTLGPVVALRRFTGGNREAVSSAAWAARQILPNLNGTTFARTQTVDIIDGTPFLAYDYAGGRSLRHIVDRARGGTGATPNPIPIDQAIVIAEKVALSLATTEELRAGGDRLTHGALIPQFIWISDDGEIRVAGQQLGRGLVSSLRDPRIAAEIGRYFAPEYRQSGLATKSSEVFSLGAILYLVVTGEEPPETPGMLPASIPEDIKAILRKSFVADAAARYPSVGDMKRDLDALANGGKYTATTFNLAFYLSTLLKKELDGEAIDRERESKVSVAPYLAAPEPVAAAPAPAPAPTPAPVTPPPLSAAPKTKSKLPVAIAAVAALAIVGGAAWLTLGSKLNAKTSTPSPQLAGAMTRPAIVPPPAPKPVVSEALVASATPEATAPATATTAQLDDTARKKAFEDAVKKKLEEELFKLQADYTRQLKQQQSRNAPVVTTSTVAPSPSPVQEERSISAAELDLQRVRTQPETATTASVPLTQTEQPAITTSQAPAPVPVAQVREGDVVEGSELDEQPHVVRKPQVIYPPVAARQKITGTVLISALVSENGDVIDVKILRGEGKMGFDEAAVRAVRTAKFSPPMKAGKRVRTWVGIPVQFK